ncbi:MAG: VWA domain-containing protein, partial [Phycisphaerales bacterium]
EFMGVRTEGRHIVYVIDRSGSMMGDRFLHTLLELKRSIERLPEGVPVSVVFFSSHNAYSGGGSYVLMPPGRMMRATAKNKRDAVDWAETITPDGGTDPADALQVALQLKPDAIFLMTDGMFDNPPAIESLLAAGNPSAKVSINTIAFHERAAEEILKRIAAKHRGDYRFVKDPRQP